MEIFRITKWNPVSVPEPNFPDHLTVGLTMDILCGSGVLKQRLKDNPRLSFTIYRTVFAFNLEQFGHLYSSGKYILCNKCVLKLREQYGK